jgi:hypothetical protein
MLNDMNDGARSPLVPKEDYLKIWYINESYAKSVLQADAYASAEAADQLSSNSSRRSRI